MHSLQYHPSSLLTSILVVTKKRAFSSQIKHETGQVPRPMRPGARVPHHSSYSDVHPVVPEDLPVWYSSAPSFLQVEQIAMI